MAQQPTKDSPLHPNDIIRHYWSRLPILVIGLVVCGALAYVGASSFVGYEFRSSATLMVRSPVSELQRGPSFSELDPPIYKDILKNDQIIHDVIMAAREEYPHFPQGNWEKLKSRFSAGILMTRDTSVQATFSPVLQLETAWNDAEIAKFLMDTWLEMVLSRYGELRARNSQQVYENALRRTNEVTDRLNETLSKQAFHERNLSAVLMEMDVLQGALMGSANGIEASQSNGLTAKIVDLELKLAGAGANDDVEAIRKELEKAQMLRTEMDAKLTTARNERSRIALDLESERNELSRLRAEQNAYRELLTASMVEAEALPDPLNPETAKGDLILLAKPVMPEASQGQSKAMVASMIFVLLSLVLISLILLELLLRRALVLTK